jgi:hypothetical protein
LVDRAWHWVTEHVKQRVAAGAGTSTVGLGVSLVAAAGCIDATDGFEACGCDRIGSGGVTLALGGFSPHIEL